MLFNEKSKLIYRYDAEELWIEAWGKNALRIRSTKESQMPQEDWALIDRDVEEASIEYTKNGASIVNGKVKAEVTNHGKIMIYNSDGKLLLEE